MFPATPLPLWREAREVGVSPLVVISAYRSRCASGMTGRCGRVTDLFEAPASACTDVGEIAVRYLMLTAQPLLALISLGRQLQHVDEPVLQLTLRRAERAAEERLVRLAQADTHHMHDDHDRIDAVHTGVEQMPLQHRHRGRRPQCCLRGAAQLLNRAARAGSIVPLPSGAPFSRLVTNQPIQTRSPMFHSVGRSLSQNAHTKKSSRTTFSSLHPSQRRNTTA